MHGNASSSELATRVTPEEEREREIGGLRRAIEAAEFRLFELSTIPNQEGLERQYALWKDEKRLALRKLKELGAKRR